MKLRKMIVSAIIMVVLLAYLPVNAVASRHEYSFVQWETQTRASSNCNVIGHTYSDLIPKVEKTCTVDGMRAHYRCTVCGKYFVEKDGKKVATSASSLKIPAGHKYGKLIPQKDATCTTDGLEAHYRCALCKQYFAEVDGEKVETTKDDLVIPAAGHTYSDLIPKVEKTCTEDGMRAHYRCTVCRKYFVEKNGNKVVTSAASLKIKAGHNYGKLIARKDATCTTDGLEAHYQCALCKQYFVEVDGEKVASTKDDLVISAAGHTYSDLIPKEEKTCTEDGMRAHYRCTVCRKYFVEKDGNKVVTSAASLKIPAGHTYGKLIARKDATCTTDGLEAHYQCALCKQYFVEVDGEKVETTKDDLVISAAGHTYSDLIPKVEKTCTEDGMRAHYRCTVCRKYFVEKNGNKVVTSAASLEIPAAGHTYSDLSPRRNPTCTEDGMKAYCVCERCSKYFVEVDGERVETTEEDLIIPATGHIHSEEEIFFSSFAEDGGDGSFEKPYNDIAVLSTLELPAGTCIYLERGSLFHGNLLLSGIIGCEDAPVIVTAYGEGELPKIDGSDLSGSGIVHIENCSNLIVGELELFDSAVTEGDRRGVLITCDNNLGSQEVVTYRNITLRDLYIHDIHGYMDAENSGMAVWSKKTGGIHLWSNDGLGRIDGLTITDCRITDVSNTGIATWYRMGAETVGKISPYTDEFADYAHRNVYIANNEISYIGKNAIYVRHLYGGVIERNVIHDTAIGCVSGNTIATSYVDGTVVQYNEGYRNMARASEIDGKMYDGCMLDADLGSKDTIWQYNYSHDNAFGLFMNCTKNDEGFHDTVIVRYNLSVNDHGNGGIIFINHASDGIYVYNNTIITGYDTEYIIQSNDERLSFFYNNLIYNRSANAKFEVNAASGMEASHNLIYNENGSRIAGSTYFLSINADGIYGEDPLFVGYLQEDSIPGIDHLYDYRVDDNSPALGTGRTVEADTDFFGNKYKESIGFYCGP